MHQPLSPRLAAVLAALPLRPGLRVVEIGGAPGALARALAGRVAPDGHVLVVDRSARGVALTERACAAEIAAGLLAVRCVAGEQLALEPGERRYDLAVANRVGALDGRHPVVGERLLARLDEVLTDDGGLWVDGRPSPRSPRS
ncbi:MAG: methyltransferase domain-containing protein [Dermatophilaceae bacterium]